MVEVDYSPSRTIFRDAQKRRFQIGVPSSVITTGFPWELPILFHPHQDKVQRSRWARRLDEAMYESLVVEGLSYGVRSGNPSGLSDLRSFPRPRRRAEEIGLLGQSYSVYSRYDFHQIGDKTFMLGWQEYPEQYKEHCAPVIDWTNPSAGARYGVLRSHGLELF